MEFTEWIVNTFIHEQHKPIKYRLEDKSLLECKWFFMPMEDDVIFDLNDHISSNKYSGIILESFYSAVDFVGRYHDDMVAYFDLQHNRIIAIPIKQFGSFCMEDLDDSFWTGKKVDAFEIKLGDREGTNDPEAITKDKVLNNATR